MSASTLALDEAFLLGTYPVYACIAFVCYEHLLSLKYEIEFLRGRIGSATTWIFMANRYLLLASMIAQGVPYDPQTCANVKAMGVLTMFNDGVFVSLVAAVFACLRMFALLRHTSVCLYVVVLLVLIGIFASISQTYLIFSQSWAYINGPIIKNVCAGIGFTVPLALASRLQIAILVANLFGQVMVLVATWANTFHQVRNAYSLGLETSLSGILLRDDGSIFFGFALFTTVFGVVSQLDTALFNGPFVIVTRPLLDILPNVLFSRFLINLSQVNTSQSVLSKDISASRYSTLNFRGRTVDAIIDNLGAPLDFGEGSSEDEEYPRGWSGRSRTAEDDQDVASAATFDSESLSDSASVASEKLAPVDTRLYHAVTWV